jgi:hypothetical protein
MTRRVGWALALGASGLAACGIWFAWQKRGFTAGLPWTRRTRSEDEAITEASEDSFPASDAPSNTPVMGSRVALGH